MKSDHPVITLLGSNSGRNLGDAAILSGILDAISRALPEAEFLVPSTHPEFIKENYGGRYRVRGVNVMPWTGSIRLLGIPAWLCFRKSDVALICDGIIFGKKFLNPLFNFLVTLVFAVPIARLSGCKVVCYSCGIGPFPGKLSAWAARWVMNLCDRIILRDRASARLAREIGVIREIQVTGDAAFINPVTPRSECSTLFDRYGLKDGERRIGVNVTSYIDAWLKSEERVNSTEEFLDSVTKALIGVKSKFNLQVVFFSTHPMDEEVLSFLGERLGSKIVTNTDLLSHDIQALMRECDLFVGMRFHSIVLASAVEVPVVGLVYAPKVRGMMDLLDSSEECLELSEVTPDRLEKVLSRAWEKRAEIKSRQQQIVGELKSGAQAAAVTIAREYFPDLYHPESESQNPKDRANHANVPA